MTTLPPDAEHFIPQTIETTGPRHPIADDQRALAVTAGLAEQYEQTDSDVLTSETDKPSEVAESFKEREARFEAFMWKLSMANERAHESAEQNFSFKWASSNRFEGMQAIIDGYAGYVIEATSRPDEVVSPDARLSAE